MGNKNTNLQNAKNARWDEFYTTYEDIQREVYHYVTHFAGKTVLCNCDDPFESNFCLFFLRHFNALKLKRLICTSYKTSRVLTTKSTFKDDDGQLLSKDFGYVLDVSKFSNTGNVLPEKEVIAFLKRSKVIKKLHCDGDFRSSECIEYLKQADIVVTNPPFSLFKEILALIIQHQKHFLIVGNQNAITYKEIFPLIRDNIVWTGYQFGEMKFRVPASAEPRSTRYWVDESGQKWRSLGNAMWLTNLDIQRRHEYLPQPKKYSPVEYPKYDTFDAINVRRITDIPCDYPGLMGVPITIVNRYNCEQFELVGEANHGSDNEYDLFKPTIKGKLLFKRILIRNRTPMIKARFHILDLFSGAGGFSYGMEKNSDFITDVALDFNAKAIDTFKHNMPHAETIVGDITDTAVKQKVIASSIARGVNMIIGGPPCQGFSLKGKKLGLADPRNYLFNEYLNLVETIHPEVFVIENVKALLATSAGWFKNQIIDKVTGLGYHVEYGVLLASDFGVPQARQRAIFICSRIGKVSLPSPTCLKSTTVREAIEDLAYLNSGEGAFEQDYTTKPSSKYQRMMREGSVRLYNHKASNHDEIAIKKLQLIPPECGKEHLPKEMLGRQQFSGTWGRLRWDDVFDASSNGTNNHPFLHRAITPREAARLQSFDDKFVFIGSKVYIRQQIGNAVPPLLAKAIADQIQRCLTR